MKLVFDFDGIICDSQSEMIRRLNMKTGKHYSLKDWSIYNCNKCFPPEDAKSLIEIFKEDVYDGPLCRPYTGTIKAMQLASKLGHEVMICTDCANEEVYRCKLKHSSDWGIDDIPIIPIYDGNKHEIECDALIEDCFETLEKNNAAYKVMLEKPWNCQLSDAGIITVRDDKELFEYVEALIRTSGLNII